MIKKNFLLFLAAVAVLFSIYASVIKISPPPQKSQGLTSEEKVAENKITLTLDFGNRDVKTFTEPPTSNSTAFSILKDVADKENLSLVTKRYSFGIFVQSINGKESSPSLSWIYFVNGTSGTIAADTYKLAPGDKVDWRYVTPSE
jgi:hypothetical protein